MIIEHLPNARPAAIRLLESAGVGGNVPIRLNVVDGFATLAYAVRGGDQTDNATQYRPCSVGLPIAGGFIIAGHCGDTSDVAIGYNGQVMGSYGGSDFPATDRAWVNVNSSWVPKPEVDAYNISGVRTITGEAAGLAVSPVNTTVCRYGRYSGERCGTVVSLSATASLSDPADPTGNTTYTFSGLTKTTACLYSTDSGGPFLSSSGYHAQGTTTGGWANVCPMPSGKYSYFEKAQNSLSQFSKTLLTTHGANAPTVGNVSCMAFGFGSYACTLSGYESQGATSVSWSASNGDGGSGVAMSGNCSTSQNININIAVTNPYGSGYGNNSFYCYAGPLP